MYDNITEEQCEILKSISCKYHIIGIEGAALYGFIYFDFTKTISAASKYFSTILPTVIKPANRPVEHYTKIAKLENVWENGNFEDIRKSRIRSRNQTVKEKEIDSEKTELMQLARTAIEDNMLFKKMFLQQTEIANKILENQTKILETPSIVHNDNSNNKKITNITVFLNTECKDAITLKEFINTLVIDDEDLMCLKTHGYVESVARLLNKALVNYDIYKRPIHCTDVKREVMHVKHNAGWAKETPDGDSPNLDKAFSRLSHLQGKKMTDFYREVEVESNRFEEKAHMMTKIANVYANEAEYKRKIIKKVIETIRL
jgi:hypothetical protein